jgi:hypothetical protein
VPEQDARTAARFVDDPRVDPELTQTRSRPDEARRDREAGFRELGRAGQLTPHPAALPEIVREVHLDDRRDVDRERDRRDQREDAWPAVSVGERERSSGQGDEPELRRVARPPAVRVDQRRRSGEQR